MTKQNLPTFRKWLMKLSDHRTAIIVVILLFGGLKILHESLDRYFAVIQSCDQPCQDAVSCEPLELEFSVSPTQIKLKQSDFVWYRARLKNRSCRLLESVSVDGFIDSDELSEVGRHLWVSVQGPDGREVKRLPVPGPDGGIAWNYSGFKGISVATGGAIHPYQPNLEVLERIRRSNRHGTMNIVALAPGEAFETVAPVLRPYRIVASSVRRSDGGLTDGYRQVPVQNPPKFPTPPEGFNILDRYLFSQPGRYTIRAGFVDEIRLYPVYARWEKLPSWLQGLLWRVRPLSGGESRKVALSAQPQVIEVRR